MHEIARARSEELREAMRHPHGVATLGVGDAFGAKVLEKKGYKCVYAGGYYAAAQRGLLDKGLYPSDYMIGHGRILAKAVGIPVVLDMDEGGAGMLNIRRHVMDLLETAPVAMFHVEDQLTPKRCGQHGGKSVHEFQMAVQRMKCVIDTRNETRSDCLFMARTDAFVAAGHHRDEETGGDIQEVIKRGCAYADLGADVVWCEFPSSHHFRAYEKFAEGVHKHHPNLPLGFNISPSHTDWNATSVNREQLNQMGYKFLFCTYALKYAELLMGTWAFADAFKANCTWALIGLMEELRRVPEIGSINQFLGITEATSLEERYDPTAAERFATSIGHK